MTDNPLGRNTEFPVSYSPEILYPIPRWPSRSLLDIDKKVPLHGFDLWRAYEVSWLNRRGKPEIGIGSIFFDARSENIVESKSLKLYLNSLNNEKFSSRASVAEAIARDLSDLTVCEVVVSIDPPGGVSPKNLVNPPGRCIDERDIEVATYLPDVSLLRAGAGYSPGTTLYSDLFRSNCPITGQPDWATFMLEYSGPEIDESSLLAYICSYRNHQGYHEECAELIFRDIMLKFEPEKLVIGLNYTRRGGLDINPFRSNNPIRTEQYSYRLERQ